MRHLIGLDRAIAYTILARVWQALAGVITLFLIAHDLTAKQQGYYYTFYSLVALQIVFELGFSFVILQLAAHERSRLIFREDGTIQGDPVAHSRLASILQKSIAWYLGAGLLMGIALMPAGFLFFARHPGEVEVAWRLPWCSLVLAATLAFQIDPVFSFLEGCGFVAQVAKRRFGQVLLGSALAWAALVSHHGLYAPALMIFGQVLVGVAYLLSNRHRRLIIGLLRYTVREHAVGWRSEILPFQWRIAVSWMCGYFIYQLFSPVIFTFQGPEAAGRMGMSLNVATGIGSIALAWMNTKASPFGTLVAKREFGTLDQLFFRTLKQSTILLTLGCAAFIGFLLIFGPEIPKFTSRLLPTWAVGLILLNSILNHVVYSEALYLRAHKVEPFLAQSIVSAVLIASATVLLGRHMGANAIAAALPVLGILFGLPSGTYLFLTHRKRLHCLSGEQIS